MGWFRAKKLCWMYCSGCEERVMEMPEFQSLELYGVYEWFHGCALVEHPIKFASLTRPRLPED